MSNLNLDDPRLTAYALGELEPGEAAQVERFLAENEAARRFVAETRAFGQSLQEGLAEEIAPGLTAAQKEQIVLQSQAAAPAARPGRPRAERGGSAKAPDVAGPNWVRRAGRYWSLPAFLAASLAIGVLVVLVERGRAQRNGEIAASQARGAVQYGGRLDAPASASPAHKNMGTVIEVSESLPADPYSPHPTGRVSSPTSEAYRGSAGDPEEHSKRLEKIGVVNVESKEEEDAFKSPQATPQPSSPVPEKPVSLATDVTSPGPVPQAAPVGQTSRQLHPEPLPAPKIIPAGGAGERGRMWKGFEEEKMREREKGESVEGRKVLDALSRTNTTLLAHELPGFFVRLGDPERVRALTGVATGTPAQVQEALLGKVGRTPEARAAFWSQQRKRAGEILGKDLGGASLAAVRSELAQHIVKGRTKRAADPGGRPDLRDAVTVFQAIDGYDLVQNAEQYNQIIENTFKVAKGEDALSTFSIDVDTGSYSNVRRMLNQGQLPPPDAVRIEELVNYFGYDYAPPKDEAPFSAQVEVAGCPWDPDHRLVRIGLKGKVIQTDQRPLSNLVFLLDVSGSMNQPNKLPLVKESLKVLVQQLGENDKVSIVVYAGASGLSLPATRGDQRQRIVDALERLQAGGSTNGGQGIELAYRTAAENFIKGGVNRVILCTDGDWNVGVTNRGELFRMIEEKAKGGVFLSVMGFGMGNLKDGMLEQLADKGNGHYGYIDTLKEARKIFGEELSGTLVTIAKDVKIQVEFNPQVAASWRLIGYENRALAREDFNDDKKDAGEIGAGHSVTALYEVVPVGAYSPEANGADPLKYQRDPVASPEAGNGELLTLKLRYKAPDGDTSRLLEFPVRDGGREFGQTTKDFRFAAAVASFGMLLRQSQYRGLSNWLLAEELAVEAVGSDPHGYRAEFLELLRKARELSLGAAGGR